MNVALVNTKEKTEGLLKNDYLVFQRGGDRFAVAKCYLQKIIHIKDVRTLPGAKAYCRGALLWNERLLALIEPAAMCGVYVPEKKKPNIGFVVGASNGQSWIWAGDLMINLKPEDTFQYNDIELAESWMMGEDEEHPHLLYLNDS